MKRLLLAPFLLASLFSFCGELKANPYSRYETTNSPLNISNPTGLNNNSSKQYSLRINLAHIIVDNKIASVTLTYPYSENFFKDFSSCQSAKRSLRDFILSQPQEGRKLKFYGSCAPADRSNKSKYEIPEYYKFQLDWVETSRNGTMDRNPEAYIPFNPAHFATKSSCEENGRRHGMQIKGWNINSVTTYKTKFKSKYICIKTSNL